MSTLRLLSSLSLVPALFGCQYDLDKIYEFAEFDAGGDAGGGGNDAAMLISQQLIAAWSTDLAVDSECVQCAEAKCAEADAACRADPECMAYTQCVGATPTPAGQATCRARFSTWVNAANVRDRDLSGPYGQCVFRDNCAAECDGNVDLACTDKYAWPSTSDRTVPLQLYLTDAQDQTKFLAGVRVRACPAGSAICPMGATEAVTNAQGFVELNLPTSFDRSFTGYLEVSEPSIVPTLIKFSWNLGSATNQIISIVNQATLMGSTTVLGGVAPDPMRGQLQLRMLGCGGIGVRGVSFTASNTDAKTKSWYIVNGIPNLTATETNVIGSGGIFDLPIPNTNVVRATATRVSDNKEVARADVPVRPGYMTVIIFAPLSTQ